MSKKSKKRRQERDEKIESLLAKVQKLEEKLQKGEESSEKVIPEMAESEPTTSIMTQEIVPGSPEKIISDSETQQEENGSLIQDGESMIQKDGWLEILGDDPTASAAVETKVEPGLLKRWEFFSKNGMKKDIVDALLTKYACIPDLVPPKLNPQISATMNDYAVTRDKHMMEVQTLASTALSMIGVVATMIHDQSEEGLDLISITKPLADAGKILCMLIHKQNVTRKAFIEPGLSKEPKVILKETKIDEYLYGKDLTDKLKDAKAMVKMAETLRTPQPKPSGQAKQNLNQKPPFVRRPNQVGSTSFAGQQKPKVFFRNKQQFVNQNARTFPHHQQRPPNKIQEKKE